MIYINTIEHLGYIEAYINKQLVILQIFFCLSNLM